jgi:MFS family permease
MLVTAAVQMQAVAIGWQIYALTKDPLALGLSGLAEAIPAISIALYGGYIADKVKRKFILQCATLVMASATGSLILFTHLGDAIHIGYFYIVIFTIGAARGFYGPAQFALLTQLTHRKHYSNSAAWNSTLWQMAAVSGPVIGGYIIGHLGYTIAYIVIASMLVAGFIMFSLIGKYEIEQVKNNEGIWHNLTLGWRFVLGQKIILSAILLDMLAVLFGGATALLPMFAGQVLLVGPVGLGYLRAAPGIGAIITALFLTYRPPTKHAGYKLLFIVGMFSVTMIVFALSENFFLSLALLAISGAFDSVSVVIRQTILQLYTPDTMRGRVAAVSTMFIGSSNEIGAFESGTAAKLLGLVPSVIFGGVTSLVSVGTIGASFKSLRTLDLTKDPNSEPPA